MEKFDSVEEEIIYNKLIKYSNTKQSDNIITTPACSNDHLSEIYRLIPELERTRENVARRPITSHRKFIGGIIVFLKKVVRKLTKFYVEPIALQQTEFNNTVTPIIGRMTQAVAEIDSEVGELKKEASAVQMLSEQFKLCSEKIIELDENMNKLKALDLDVFNDKNDSFWIKNIYSQAGEDSICAYILMVMGYKWEDCTYLDLGANHAKELSNTYFFYKRGAHGVLLEANPELIPELKFYRNRDVVLNKCVTTTGEGDIDFYIMNGDGLSTFDLDSANVAINANSNLKITKTVKVESITVNEIIENYMGKTPTIVNIDIEGKDIDILGSIDFEKYRPLIIIAEMIEYSPTLMVGMKNQEILDYMMSVDYTEYAFTGINSIFIDKRRIEK
ncbi:MAG: FkbM family methyltransferase [Clostridium sp.]|nr:FkbM family methyltransferase [Clostridium sp.]